jgi:gliding motility-associated lipoprotein GldH
VRYSLKDSSGNVLQTDLVNGQLFESISGKPLGEGLGDVFDHQFSILEEYTFPGTGNYHIELNQYMRRDTLPEILAVGVRVEKAMKE